MRRKHTFFVPTFPAKTGFVQVASLQQEWSSYGISSVQKGMGRKYATHVCMARSCSWACQYKKTCCTCTFGKGTRATQEIQKLLRLTAMQEECFPMFFLNISYIEIYSQFTPFIFLYQPLAYTSGAMSILSEGW